MITRAAAEAGDSKILSIQESRINKRVFIAVTGLLLRGTVQDFFDVISLASTGQTFTFVEEIVSVLGLALFIYGLISLLNEIGQLVVVTTAHFAFVMLLSVWLHPENMIFVRDFAADFFFRVLPFMWIGFFLIKRKLYLDFFLKVARVKLSIALLTQILIFLIPSADIFNDNYMNAANSLLIGLISVYYLATKEKKVLDIVLSVCGTVIILVSGSRGVFMSLIVFWIMYLLLNSYKNKANLIITIILGSILAMAFGDTILQIVSKLSNSIGFSTHLIDALQNSTLLEDSSRLFLYRNFWNAILEHPLWGYGVLGDRYISTAFFYKPIYPHNIILEMLVNGGFLVGAPIVISLFVSIIKSLRNRNPSIRDMIMVLSCSCIVKLMVSSSFWNDQIFSLLVGALIAISYEAKKNRIGVGR